MAKERPSNPGTMSDVVEDEIGTLYRDIISYSFR